MQLQREQISNTFELFGKNAIEAQPMNISGLVVHDACDERGGNIYISQLQFLADNKRRHRSNCRLQRFSKNGKMLTSLSFK